jgi:predicted secreted Zn-dependent protease
MAIAISNLTVPQMEGNRRKVRGTVTFDNSYVTGGEPLTLKSIGLDVLEDLVVDNPQASATTSYVITWNRSATAPTLKVHGGAASGVALAEVANTTDLSALVCRFEATGF